MGECGWPGCDHPAQISGDGGRTAWCWCHVEVPVEVRNLARLETCVRCGQSTVHAVGDVTAHPRCYRPWLILRAAAAL